MNDTRRCAIVVPEDLLARCYDDVRSSTGGGGDVGVDEDHLQEAVIRYWEQLTYGTAIRSAPAWVRVVARNLARSELRRRQAESRALQRTP